MRRISGGDGNILVQSERVELIDPVVVARVRASRLRPLERRPGERIQSLGSGFAGSFNSEYQ
jgi:hypothetical protein